MNSLPSFTLKLLGSPSIQGPGGALLGGQAAQRHRIALLALLARALERGVSREKLMGYLWPESAPDQARNLLNVSVYVLRKALGEDALLSAGDQLRLNPQVIRSDVAEFDASVLQGDHERAAITYEGAFLDGFFLSNAPDFEQWVDRERDRLAGSYAKALEALAEAAEGRADPAAGAGWWKARAAQDPYDSRVARRLIQTLAAAGNPAAALQHATIHERLLMAEFGVQPERETLEVVESIRQRGELHDTVQRSARAAPDLTSTRADTDATDAPDIDAADLLRAGDVAVQRAATGSSDIGAADAPIRATSHRIRRTRIPGWAMAAAALLALWGVAAVLSSGTGTAFERSAAGADGSHDEPVGSVARPVAPPRSVAVLPFRNVSSEPGEEYFSDGLAEELIGALGQIGALRVAARTSSFAFKGTTGDIRRIGEALNVATVLEGSVRRDGDRLVVLARLIDVADGLHLWSGTYERRFTEVFEIQRDLALQIAGALEVELTPGERQRLASPPTVHAEAFRLYLMGRHFWNQRTPIGYARAIEYFQRATALDPQYAAAHAGLAAVYSLEGMAGAVGADTARERARQAALRAIELDDGIAEAHTVLGLYLHAYEWNAPAAEREFVRSIALDPSHAQARQWYGNLLSATGRIDEAVEQKRRAVELDPLMPASSEMLAFTLARAGRLDEARRHVANALELDSTYWRAHAVAGLIHELLNHPDSAVRAYERANELARGRSHRTRADIARVLAHSGRRDEARHLVAQLRTDADATGIHDPAVATALLALGDADAAFDWLEQVFRQKHPDLVFIGGDARFAGFDREPRFADLMRRVGMWR